MTKMELEAKLTELKNLLNTLDKENKNLSNDASEYQKIIKSLQKDNIVQAKFISQLKEDLVDAKNIQASKLIKEDKGFINFSDLINLIAKTFLLTKIFKIS
jgi:hypothetical protein